MNEKIASIYIILQQKSGILAKYCSVWFTSCNYTVIAANLVYQNGLYGHYYSAAYKVALDPAHLILLLLISEVWVKMCVILILPYVHTSHSVLWYWSHPWIYTRPLKPRCFLQRMLMWLICVFQKPHVRPWFLFPYPPLYSLMWVWTWTKSHWILCFCD